MFQLVIETVKSIKKIALGYCLDVSRNQQLLLGDRRILNINYNSTLVPNQINSTIKYNQSSMSNTQGNNLLTFLKKQSLFSNSPSKGSRKRSSRSKDKSGEIRQPSPIKATLEDGYSNRVPLFPSTSDKNLLEYQKNNTHSYSPIQNVNIKATGPLIDSRFQAFEDFEERKGNRNTQPQTFKDPNDKGNMWTGLVSYSSSFQSARIESAQCLDNLANKLRSQISQINLKIENFNTKMTKVINGEFKNLREKIYHIVEEVFKDSEKYIQEYMKFQEDRLAGEVIKMRNTLQTEYTKIESMREEIGKTNWRKIAGQIIANELELKVNAIAKQSSALEIGRWQLGDLMGYRLKDLEKDLRDVVRLKKDV